MFTRYSLKMLGMLCFLAAAGITTAQQPVEKLLGDYKKNAQTTPNDEQRITEMRDGKYLLTVEGIPEGNKSWFTVSFTRLSGDWSVSVDASSRPPRGSRTRRSARSDP